MPRANPEDRLAKLKKDKAQLEAQIKRENARLREQKRKDDIRRKIVAGALALKHMERGDDAHFTAAMDWLLNTYVTGKDRKLFGLPEEPPEAAQNKAGAGPQFTSAATGPG